MSNKEPAFFSRESPREAPGNLVDNGKINFGIYHTPFSQLNMLDADWAPVPVPAFVKYLRLKEWQAYQMGSSDFFFFAVLYKSKSVSLAQFFVYNRHTKEKLLYEALVPDFRIHLPVALSEGSGRFTSRNFELFMDNNTDAQRLDVSVWARGGKNLPALSAQFTCHYDSGHWTPLVVALPFSVRRGMYSHKCLMPMSGQLSINGKNRSFDIADSFAIIDDHKGYYPWSLAYDWATGVLRNNNGRLCGFNLTDNQAINREVYNENCFWDDGQVHLLPPVKFERPEGTEGPWHIRDDYGMVDVLFTPESFGKIDMDLLVIKSHYRGHIGSFSGRIRSQDGTTYDLDGFFGMGEEKKLRL